ncbi:MAG TPA: hypothetical protein VET27_23930 [Mycobacterium sp.]|nr:hypothetical protein [Mycobacterium sp.]
MRPSLPPAPHGSRPPSEADCYQAATFAQELALLIADGRQRAENINAEADRALQRDMPKTAGRLRGEANLLQQEIDEMCRMHRRLRLRFPAPSAAG